MLALTALGVKRMATLTIRGLPEPVRQALKRQAAAHDRSMEAEARAILEAAVTEKPDFIGAWLDLADGHRGEFTIPVRSQPRTLDFA